jgi:hypothetical protein
MSLRIFSCACVLVLVSSLGLAQPRRPRPRPRVRPVTVVQNVPSPVAPPPTYEPVVQRPPPVVPMATVPIAVSQEPHEETPLPPALDVALGVRGFQRQLSYHQDLYGNFRPYDLTLAPAIVGSLAWYPAAHFTGGWLSGFGLLAEGDYAFALSSQDASGTVYPTQSFGLLGALQYRVPLGASEVSVSVGYGMQTFSVETPTTPADTGVPALEYQYVRGAVATRIALSSRVAITAHGAYLHVLGTGELSDRFFPRSNVGGVEASLGLAFKLTTSFEIRALLNGRRYFFAMNPEPGDPWVVGGAVDQYLSGSLMFAFRR